MAQKPLLVCFSHLRWDFVFQRPQHLLSRAAAAYRVVFVEEPGYAPPGQDLPRMSVRAVGPDLTVATPLLPEGCEGARAEAAQRRLLDGLLGSAGFTGPIAVAWYYTPMALAFSGHLSAAVTVYDCMDELSAFQGASPALRLLERRLMQRADLVFAGGRSLYDSKRTLHPHAHLFASGVDAAHFRQALAPVSRGDEPADQRDLPHPRLGWFGVVDERMDLDLVRDAATMRPDWSFVMLGPVVKIDPATLPVLPNIHWLGLKAHGELPRYLAGWDVGIMPFAMNEATRYISPTKTPEYLAAGVPVVPTPVADVVRDWGADGGTEGLVAIAADAAGFVAAAEAAMARPRETWMPEAERRLARVSWDGIWSRMEALLRQAAHASEEPMAAPPGTASAPAAGTTEAPHV